MNWNTRFRYIFLGRLTKPLRLLFRGLTRIFTIVRLAFLLIIIAGGIWYFSGITPDDLWPNIVPELLSIAVTVLFIDTLYRKRDDLELKKVLIQQMKSKNNAVASAAFHEFTAHGWLSDGSLQRALFLGANLDGNTFSGADMRKAILSFASLKDTTWFEADLEGAFLDHADLQDASLSLVIDGPHVVEANLTNVTLSFANLRNASYRHQQLSTTRSLWRAIMCDGTIYDGRYNLQDDIDLFRKSAIDSDSPLEIAKFYGVSLDQYLKGQEWGAKTKIKIPTGNMS